MRISSFYKFTPIPKEELNSRKILLESWVEKFPIRGLILLSEEGYNATIAGTQDDIENYLLLFKEHFATDEMLLKESTSEFQPFRRFKVDLRTEIITFNGKHLNSTAPDTYLTPAEWQRTLDSDEEYILIDTRNDYETRLGIFDGAIDPKIKVFSEFPEWFEKQQFKKDQKILMYCTGGVRCEKAVVEFKERGYTNIWQLHGGILNYIEQFPNQHYQGDCYVFDHRVGVDQELKPSTRFKLCPLCGDPGDKDIDCAYCEKKSTICSKCLEALPAPACTKNCRHHLIRQHT